MKIKEVTLSHSQKMPIQGVQFSNKESSFSITLEVEEEDQKKIWEINADMWEKIKQEVARGLDEDQQKWLQNDTHQDLFKKKERGDTNAS